MRCKPTTLALIALASCLAVAIADRYRHRGEGRHFLHGPRSRRAADRPEHRFRTRRHLFQLWRLGTRPRRPADLSARGLSRQHGPALPIGFIGLGPSPPPIHASGNIVAFDAPEIVGRFDISAQAVPRAPSRHRDQHAALGRCLIIVGCRAIDFAIASSDRTTSTKTGRLTRIQLRTGAVWSLSIICFLSLIIRSRIS